MKYLKAAVEWAQEANEIVVDHLSAWLSWAGARRWAVVLVALSATTSAYFIATHPKPKGPQIIASGSMGGFAAAYTLPSQLKFNASQTGSVTRTLADKLTDLPSVRDYGAHSNTESGFTTFDSSAAFTACLAINNQCFVPRGRYHVDSVTLPQGGQNGEGIYCDGANDVTLWNDAGSAAIQMSGTSYNSNTVFGDFITIQGCRFELSNNSRALALNRHSGAGVVAGLAQVNFLDNTVYSADGGRGLDLIGVMSGLIRGNAFYGTQNYTSTFDAIVMETIADSYVLNVNISENVFSAVHTAITLDSTAADYAHNAGHRIVNNLFIGATGYGIYLQNLDHVTIQGNMLDYMGCGASGGSATAAIFADSVVGLRIIDNPWIASRYTCPAIDIRASNASVGEFADVVVSRNTVRNISYGGAGSSGILLNTSNAVLNFFDISQNNINIAQTCISVNATGSTVVQQGTIRANVLRGCPTGITFGAQNTGHFVAENVFESTVTTPVAGAGIGNVGFGINTFSGNPTNWPHALTYSASMTPNGITSDHEVITITNGTAFTINQPTNIPQGGTITFYLKNTSGGAAGVATWSAFYKMAGAWVQPATGNGRTITFMVNGGLYYEISRSAADVPN